jgi:ankyrin repeat protein
MYKRWGPDGHGFDALMQAAKGGHADCVKLLLAKSDAFRFDSNNRTALMHAVNADSPSCVALLVRAGNPRARGDINRTQEAIHVAARMGKPDCLAALLEVVPHDAKDADGASAMHVAARWGHAECVRVLLARGIPDYCWEPASQKSKSKRVGDNPMHLAASGASDDAKGWAIVELLREKWDLDSVGSRGLTVAQLARAAGKLDMAARVESVLEARRQKAELDDHLGGVSNLGGGGPTRSL